MRIAVVQHRVRSSRHDDVAAVASAARAAAALEPELVVLCEVPSLYEEGGLGESLREIAAEHLGDRSHLVPHLSPGTRSAAFEDVELPGISDRLGPIVVLEGDACMDVKQLERIAVRMPSVLIMLPRSESDLQAEAVLELAIGLSESLAGLVIVAEASGAEPGQAGHGGSAIISVGEVVAEATEDDDVLVADILEPAPQPMPREPLPAVPTLLQQRIAHHAGARLEVDYPTDLA